MNSSRFEPGASVVTNTMIVKAAQFLEGTGHMPDAVETFFDFCGLVEAVVIRKQLVTLDGDLLGREDQYASSSLPSTLRNEGILIEHGVPIDPNDVQRALCLVVGTDRVFNRIDVRGMSVYITEMLPEVFPDEVHIHKSGDPMGPERYCFMMLARHADAGHILRRAQSVFHFFRSEDFLDFLRGTGDSARGGYALRTYLYSRAAWKSNLAFMPDFPRVRFLESLLDELHQCTVTEGYQLLAERLRFEAEDFLADARPLGLPTPPFTSLLLSRCSSVNDIIPELLGMREEFSDLRENLSKLEEERLTSTNINERNKTRRKVEAIFSATAKKFSVNGHATLKSVLDYVGDVSEPVFDWSNPSSYKVSLITKPYEWLRDWWLRRPLAQLFDVAREFRRIEEYNQLVQRVFGIEFNIADIERFRNAVANIHRSFQKEGENG